MLALYPWQRVAQTPIVGKQPRGTTNQKMVAEARGQAEDAELLNGVGRARLAPVATG